MKKSFMTRALATGLSLAMAFSLSAATNVTTAEAASLMKASSKTVTEGKTAKAYMTSSMAKKYRIKSHKESTVAKKYISVAMMSSRKGLKITAKEGALAAANLEKKGVQVKINFVKASSAKAAKKATKIAKTATLKVVVKAKPVEKLTMTAEATKVKQLTVTFNKAVDTTTTKLVVKKGTVTPTVNATTFAADGKSATIAMGTKLTAGTYTVEATVGEEKLTADVAVQDEKMTAFELVSKDLIAAPDCSTTASISYKAVNQYGEMMAPGSVQATCSFGKVDDGDSTAPTADKAGKVVVKNINDALAIVGTTGTIVLVDTTNGVNLNETITYQSKAVANTVNVVGIYNDKTEKLVEGNLNSNTKVTDYYVMMNVQNQYGSDMSFEDIQDSGCELTFNPASVLTNLTIAETKIGTATTTTNIKELTYDGKNCILVKLAAGNATNTSGTIEKAGTFTMTIVSAQKGVVASPSFTVDDAVMIATLSVTPADTVYFDTDNKLVVEAIDANGNLITKYDDLKNSIASTTNGVSLKKNADGTGTFYFKPQAPDVKVSATKANKYKDSTITTLIFSANDNTSGKYIVKTTNVTVYAKPQAWKVSGTTKDSVTAVAKNAEKLVFDLSKLNYEDQYGNTINYDKVDEIGDVSNIKYYLKDDNNIFGADITKSTDGKKLEIPVSGAGKGTATLYLQYNSTARIEADTAETMNDTNFEKYYDIKVDLSVTDTTSLVATDLTLNVNDGKTVCGIAEVTVEPAIEKASQATTDDAVKVVVTGRVGGKTVVIPTDDWTIIDGKKLGGYGKIDKEKNIVEKTEEKTITVVVDSSEGPQTVTATVTVSNANPKATEIKKDNDAKVAKVDNILSADIQSTIKIVDQYGITMSVDDKEVVYTVTLTGNNANELKVVKNGTQNVSIIDNPEVTTTSTKYTASVKYVYGGVEFTQDVTFEV